MGPQQASVSIAVASKGGLNVFCTPQAIFFFKDELLRQISLHDAEENWPNFKRVPWAYPEGGGYCPKTWVGRGPSGPGRLPP